jgi:PhnB protein
MTDTQATSGLIPYVNVDGAANAIEFYKKAFGAIEHSRSPASDDDPRVMHAHIEINGAPLFLSDFFPEHDFPIVAPQGYNLHLQVDDAQTWFDRAAAAGATVTMPLAVQFWGDTYGQLKDPYGITWAVGQSKAE